MAARPRERNRATIRQRNVPSNLITCRRGGGGIGEGRIDAVLSPRPSSATRTRRGCATPLDASNATEHCHHLVVGGAAPASGDELLRGWIEQDQVREIELELRLVAGAEVEIGLETGRELVAPDVQDDQGVRAGGLDDYDLPIDHRPALRTVAVACGPGPVADGLGPQARDDLAAGEGLDGR